VLPALEAKSATGTSVDHQPPVNPEEAADGTARSRAGGRNGNLVGQPSVGLSFPRLDILSRPAEVLPTDPPMIFFRLLGGARVEIDEDPAVGPAAQRRRLALLALLAAGEPRVSRERLIGLLWPETTEQRARHLLSESVYVIRKSLGEDLIQAEGEHLHLNRTALRCDLWEFQGAVAAGDFESAVAAYAGPFLDGMNLDDAPEFEHWAETERARHARTHHRGLEELASSLESAGDHRRALDVLGRLAALDPHSARVALKLMRLYEATGDRAAAIQHARVHSILLQEDLGAEPDPEVAAYAERLRKSPALVGPAPGVRDSSVGPAPVPPSSSDEDAGPGVFPPGPPDPHPEPARARGRPVRHLGIAAAMTGAGTLLLIVAAVMLHRPGPAVEAEAAPAPVASIAVLPFASGTVGEAVPEHVRQGIAEELIHALSQVGGLRVTSSTSSFLFRSRGEIGVREIGERLGVDVVLIGAVVHRGDAISIRAELVDVLSGFNIWSKQFDRDLDEVSSFPGEIARTLAATLGRTLVPQTRTTSSGRWSDDPRALELYWLGRAHWNRRTPDGFRDAAKAFEEAIVRDRSFALAYAGLADIHAQALWAGLDPSAAYAAARTHAEEALKLAPELAEPHATLGVVHLYHDRDWGAAEREFQRALELNSSYATAHHWYGALLGLRGETAAALEMLERAEEIDPLSAPIRTSIGTVLYYARRYEQAKEQYRRALEIESSFWPALAQRACANLMQGRHDDALADARQALAVSQGNPVALAVLSIAHAHAGNREEARRVQREIFASAEGGRYVSPTLLAGTHVALGDVSSALDLLQAALDTGDDLTVVLAVEPLFDRVRDVPAFQQHVESARRPPSSADPSRAPAASRR
jgi:DNA-binding SARP family transcriptional activator/TolB-like protein/Tfp pilus assembly protein PilF